MLRDEDWIPIPDLLRVRVYSRHRGLTKYQLCISYKSATEDNDNEPDDIQPLINGHYCLCKSGAKTLGTCAHVTCILWFYGYALPFNKSDWNCYGCWKQTSTTTKLKTIGFKGVHTHTHTRVRAHTRSHTHKYKHTLTNTNKYTHF